MKFVIGFFVLVIFLALLAFQIGAVNVQTVKAQSGPITSPITAPITSPITYFNIVGRVFYMASGPAIPAVNIRVMAQSTPSGKFYTTSTNADGRYSLRVPSGKYIVLAYDTKGSLFRPFNRIVNVFNKNVFGVNFGAHI